MHYASMDYEKRDLFMKALADLYIRHPRLARVVYLRTVYDLKWREIGEEIGVSANRAIQLDRKGLGMMKFYMTRILRVQKDSALTQKEYAL